MKTEIVTEKGSESLSVYNGNVLASHDKDVWKVAAFDRTSGSAKHTVAFLRNFGAEIGAFASTWSFHENDMIVIGSNEKDMTIAANHLAKTQGGVIVVNNVKSFPSCLYKWQVLFLQIVLKKLQKTLKTYR